VGQPCQPAGGGQLAYGRWLRRRGHPVDKCGRTARSATSPRPLERGHRTTDQEPRASPNWALPLTHCCGQGTAELCNLHERPFQCSIKGMWCPLPETYDQPTVHAFVADVAVTPFRTFSSELPGAAFGEA
jgi:hypothetical protein